MGVKPFILLLALTSLVALVSGAPVPPDDYTIPASANDLIYNGTYTQYWMFNLTHGGGFDVYGIAYGLMLPILNVYGYWVFLIIWATYLLMVWIRTGEVGLPLVIGIISAGVWAMIIPTAAYLYIGVMFAIALAAVLFKAFTDR